MSPKPVCLSACLLFLGMVLAIPAWPSQQETRQTEGQELDRRLDALEQNLAARLEAQEKLAQAKVDQAAAISQTLENGRKDVDWWLSSLAILLGVISVLAVVIPTMLQNRHRREFEADLSNIRETFSRLQDFEKQMKADMREGLDNLRRAEREVREHLKTAEQAANKTVALSEEAERAKRTLVEGKQPEELRMAADELGKVQDSPIAKLSAKALELARAGQWEEAVARWRALTDLEPGSVSHWFNLGYAFQELAATSKSVLIPNMAQACQAYSEVVRVKPDMHEAWYNWGNALAAWALALPEAERSAKFAEAGEKYAEAVRVKPDKHEAWTNWGSALAAWAQALPEAERPAKFAEAGEKYAEAVRVKPDMHEAWYNWGSALADWALALPEAERSAKFAEAGEKYAEAVRVKPDKHEAWNNWGNALAAWTQALPEAERPAKFAEAGEKYAEAVRVKPDKHEAWTNWGSALADWALALPEAERSAKFAEAGEKYAEAVRVKPDKHEAWNNWGNALLLWWRVAPEVDRPRLLMQAHEVLLKAEALKSGSGAYNLACVAALGGHSYEAKGWLEKSRGAGEPVPHDCHNLRTDPDLDSLRELPWFMSFVDEACGNQAT